MAENASQTMLPISKGIEGKQIILMHNYVQSHPKIDHLFVFLFVDQSTHS